MVGLILFLTLIIIIIVEIFGTHDDKFSKQIDIRKSRIIFSDNSNFEIQLYNSNYYPIDFTNNIKINIIGDGIGCPEFSQQLTNDKLSYKKKIDNSTNIEFQYVSGVVPVSLISQCQEYYIISFTDQFNVTNIISYYKEIIIYNPGSKNTRLYESMRTTISDPVRVDMAQYLIKVAEGVGFDTFFDFTDEIRKNQKKTEAAIYFSLNRIFQKFNILHFEIIDRLNLHGDLNVLNNRFQIIPVISQIGQKFFKIKLLIKDEFNIFNNIIIFLDENCRMLVPNLKGVFDVFHFNADGLKIKVILGDIALRIITDAVFPYAGIYNNLNNIYKMINNLCDSCLGKSDSLLGEITKILGIDIDKNFESLVAFDKNRFIDFDVAKLLSKEFIHSAISFVGLKSFGGKGLKFLSVDFSSIKSGLASGFINMISPQGKSQLINIKDKKVYESLVYCLEEKTNKIVSFVAYSLHVNFNFLIKSRGSEKEKFMFIPDIPDGRSTYIAQISGDYINSIQTSIEYLEYKYVEIRKKYEDKNVNPDGSKFDLCRDNSVKNQNILIGLFHNTEFDDKYFEDNILKSLSVKGFRSKYIKTENDFIEEIKNNGKQYTSAWIIPTYTEFSQNFADIVFNFYQSGKSLFIWGDNYPFVKISNSIIKKVLNSADFYLDGNYPGEKVLRSGNGSTAGTFDSNHPISRGFVKLYEGNTVCSWNKDFPGFKSFGMLNGLENKPVIFYREATTTNNRILVDCGFTKLMSAYFNENTRRYIVNSACWLASLENDPEVEN